MPQQVIISRSGQGNNILISPSTTVNQPIIANASPPPSYTFPTPVVWFKGENNFNDAMGHMTPSTVGTPLTFGTGMVGSCIYCPGNQAGYIAYTNASTYLTSPSFSVELWRKRAISSDSNTSYHYAYYCGAASGGWTFSEGGSGSGNGMLTFGQTMIVNSANSTTSLPQDTNWHHIGMSWDNVAMICRFYIDGSPAGVINVGRTFTWTMNQFQIAGYYNGGVAAQFYGYIDELSYYNQVLTDTDFNKICAAGAAGKTY